MEQISGNIRPAKERCRIAMGRSLRLQQRVTFLNGLRRYQCFAIIEFIGFERNIVRSDDGIDGEAVGRKLCRTVCDLLNRIHRLCRSVFFNVDNFIIISGNVCSCLQRNLHISAIGGFHFIATAIMEGNVDSGRIDNVFP